MERNEACMMILKGTVVMPRFSLFWKELERPGKEETGSIIYVPLTEIQQTVDLLRRPNINRLIEKVRRIVG